MKHTGLLFAILTVALAFSSCRFFRVQEHELWQETQISTRNQKVLFESVVLAMGKEGFRVGSGADAGGKRVESGWRTHGSPFKGRGYRERAVLTYEISEQDAFLVRVRVQRETNESLRPLVPNSAKWKRAPDQPDIAKRILQYVHSYLGGDWTAVKEVPIE